MDKISLHLKLSTTKSPFFLCTTNASPNSLSFTNHGHDSRHQSMTNIMRPQGQFPVLVCFGNLGIPERIHRSYSETDKKKPPPKCYLDGWDQEERALLPEPAVPWQWKKIRGGTALVLPSIRVSATSAVLALSKLTLWWDSSTVKQTQS